MPTKGTLKNGRRECPKCHKAGLGYANNPEKPWYKMMELARCRFCRTMFSVVDSMEPEGAKESEK